MMEAIERNSIIFPKKFAAISNGNPITYQEMFDQLLSYIEYYKSVLPENIGIIWVKNNNLFESWISLIALRSLGHTTIAAHSTKIIMNLSLDHIGAVVFDKMNKEEADPLIHKYCRMMKIKIPHQSEFEKNDSCLNLKFSHKSFGGHIEFTSGSTGTVKAILRPGRLLQDLCDRAVREFHLDQNSIFHIGNLPPNTGVGSKAPLACWSIGATCIFEQRRNWSDYLHEYEPDRIFMIPERLQEYALKANPQEIKSPANIYCGGGHISQHIYNNFRKKYPHSLYINYAATEFGVRLQNKIITEEDLIWLQPVSNAQIEIVKEDGNEAKFGEEGIVRAKLQSCDPNFYLNSLDATQKHFRDEYFYTSDIAVRRTDNKIRILGRQNDVINLSGHKIPVEKVEIKACQILEVGEVRLTTRQDDEGQIILSIVTEESMKFKPALAKRLAQNLIKHFSKIEFHTIVQFPRQNHGMNKIQRSIIPVLIDKATPSMVFVRTKARSI